MKISRDLQRKVLEMLAEAYPSGCANLKTQFNEIDPLTLFANMQYLAEYGLMISGARRSENIGASSDWQEAGYSRITAQGMDFLADDGGLGGILGVVTIKLHDDTLKHLIGQKIQESDLPALDKKKWTDSLRSLPADATKHLAMKLMDLGLKHAPDAIHAIGTYVSP